MSEFLEFVDISKHYGAVKAVDHISLEVKQGEFFSLLGPSGCGKTTLLRMLGGFERPDSGRIFLEGKDPFLIKMEDRHLANQLNLSYCCYLALGYRQILVLQHCYFLCLDLDLRK